jgi:DNA replication protein DnaC
MREMKTVEAAGTVSSQFAAKINLLRIASTGAKSQPTGTIEARLDMAQRLEGHGVYKRFRGATIANMDLRGVPEDCQSQWKIVKEYAANLQRNINNGSGIILVGPVGTMKTTMAVSVLRELIDKRDAGYFIPMVSLLDMLNQSRDRHDGSLYKLEQRIRTTQLLVLDDLGAEYDHTWVQAKVDAIITERYNRMKSTIITSNLGRDEIRDRYQQRIFDRLKETSIMVTFKGKSQRKPMHTKE